MVAHDNENRTTDSSISISKGCTVSGVPDEYVHLCENKRLSIFTVTNFLCLNFFAMWSLPQIHNKRGCAFCYFTAVTVLLHGKETTWYLISRPGRASISSLWDWTCFKGLLSKNLVLWQHLFYSYHVGTNEAAHAAERDRAQKRDKFIQNQG